MRRRLLTLIVLALLLAVAGAAQASPVFLISGAGWGHGIGMAQYGAHGFAQNGWTYDQILAHYYPGTALGFAPTARIRVLLASRRDALEIASDSPFAVRDAQGRVALPAGAYRLGRDLTLEVEGQPRTLVSPLRVVPGKSPLRLGGRAYRGTLVVSLAAGGLTAVNAAKLEQYVKGVVAGEMPPDWHPEALEVQAVAARSYALASRRPGRSFDVFADTRSQVYGGIAAEDPRTSAAVDATKGQVVLFEGKVAWTFFFASSGGKTAAAQDVWPDSEQLPYLVSVDDPYDDISPYHRWGPLAFTAEQLAARLGSRLPSGLTDLKVNLNASGRVATVTAIGTGGTTEIPGWEMRTLLGLRSTMFQIDAAEGLSASSRRVLFGQKVTLSGVARGADEVALEERSRGGKWHLLQTVAVKPNGRFSLTVRPQLTTSYRARFPSSTRAPVRVVVAPSVTLDRKERPGALEGVMRPELLGTTVTIERLGSAGWEQVASAVVGGAGIFVAELDLAPGVYRARIPATAGLAAGTSPRLTIDAG